MEKPTDDSEHSEVVELSDETNADDFVFDEIGFLVEHTKSRIELLWKIASGLYPPLDDEGDLQLEYPGDFDTYVESIWRQSDRFLTESLTQDLPEFREIATHLSMMGNLLSGLRHTWAMYRYSEEHGGPPPPNLSSKRRIAREYYKNAYQASYIPTIQALARLDTARRSSPVKTQSAEIPEAHLTEHEATVHEIICKANREGGTINNTRILDELEKLGEDGTIKTIPTNLRTAIFPRLAKKRGLKNLRTETGEGDGYYYPDILSAVESGTSQIDPR